MIKAKDRRMDLPPGAKTRPREMIGIARLDHIGPDVIEHIEDDLRIQDQPVAGRIAREKIKPRRADGVEMQPSLALVAGRAAGNDEMMFVARMSNDMKPLFRDVTLHPAADRRVKLGDIANLHLLPRGRIFKDTL